MSPASAANGTVDRFDVRSADGTSLAVWVDGEGPPLVLVHGGLQDHTRLGPLMNELSDDVATFAMDRRGRGASGDGPDYSIHREFEDVAAVVDAVADRTGGPVALWGHSYGANCAMGGATLTRNVHHLVLYEPGLGTAYPTGAIEAVEQAVATGDSEAAIVAVLVQVAGATDDEIDEMRASPLWPSRIATAPTVPRELRTEHEWVYLPGQFDAIAPPTLVLAGSESPALQDEATRRAIAAIPGAEIRVLEGHGHFAFQTDPGMVATIIREFALS